MEGVAKQEIAQDIQQELVKHFRPEFLNRIDEIVVFANLTQKDIRRIVDVQLRQLNERLREKQITLEVSEEAKRYLAERGYDPAYGARPLKRLMQTAVMDPLARELIEGRIKEGDTVRADVQGGRVMFKTGEKK